MAVVAVFSAFGLLVTTRGEGKARFASHDELGQGGSLEGDESAAQAGQRELREDDEISRARANGEDVEPLAFGGSDPLGLADREENMSSPGDPRS